MVSELQNFKSILNKDWFYSFNEIRFGNHVIIKVGNEEYFFDKDTEKYIKKKIVR